MYVEYKKKKKLSDYYYLPIGRINLLPYKTALHAEIGTIEAEAIGTTECIVFLQTKAICITAITFQSYHVLLKYILSQGDEEN